MRLKYQLTDETKTLWDGTVLCRIEALREGPWGSAGTLGGCVQSELNLSHKGNCWVYENAMVFGNARVSENAYVYDKASVYQNACIFGNAWVYHEAEVSGNAKVSGNAQVFGNQKVNGDCFLDGYEKGKNFKVNNLCLCDYHLNILKKYHGCCWVISQVHEGWIQAKHGDEEIAFRNEWLRKL